MNRDRMLKLSTLDYLLQKYNKRLLKLDEVGAEINMQPQSIRNAITNGTFPIPTVKNMRFRMVKIEHLAQYIDSISSHAEKQFKKGERFRAQKRW